MQAASGGRTVGVHGRSAIRTAKTAVEHRPSARHPLDVIMARRLAMPAALACSCLLLLGMNDRTTAVGRRAGTATHTPAKLTGEQRSSYTQPTAHACTMPVLRAARVSTNDQFAMHEK